MFRDAGPGTLIRIVGVKPRCQRGEPVPAGQRQPQRRSSLVALEALQNAPNASLGRRQMLMHHVPDHRIGDDLVVVAQDIADARDLMQGIPGSAAFSFLGMRRLASAMISISRSTARFIGRRSR